MGNIDNLVRNNIRKMAPYPGPSETFGEVKLNQNESPYNLPKEVKQKIKEKIDVIDFNRYSEGSSKGLRERLGKKFNVDPDQVVLGCGMDELFYYTIMTFVSEGEKIVRPIPSFAMYKVCADVAGAKDAAVELGDKFKLTEKFVKESKDAKLTFLCRPNSQTGNSWDKKIIEKIIKGTSGIVFIDEAYAEFAQDDCLEFLKYENVIIGRTFSKVYSAAGVRLGYILANKRVAEYINRVRLPWNLSVLTQIIGEILLDNEETFLQKIPMLNANRKKMLTEMRKIVEVLDSETNFLSFKVKDAKRVFEGLEKRGILVRNITKYPKMSDYLRVNIGTDEENAKFLVALSEILGKGENSAKVGAVIFDIDGVLVDVSQSYREAIKQTVKLISGREVCDADIDRIKQKPNSNNDWDVTYALVTGLDDLASIDRNDLFYTKIKQQFQELYLGSLRNCEIPIAKLGILKVLVEYGYKLGVVTSRPRTEAIYVLDRFFPNIFKPKCVVAQEDCKYEKPDPDPILLVMERMNCTSAIYIGDTVNDGLAARAAKLKFASVTQNLEADYLLKDVNEILGVLE
ncbi:MAG: histidinol-phosphate transaminase [Candidatus Micrarchaeota archaeon]